MARSVGIIRSVCCREVSGSSMSFQEKFHCTYLVGTVLRGRTAECYSFHTCDEGDDWAKFLLNLFIEWSPDHTPQVGGKGYVLLAMARL